MTTRRCLLALVLAALIVPTAGTVFAADGGRVDLSSPIRIFDSRSQGGPKTRFEIGSGAFTVAVFSPSAVGTAVIHPCSQPAPTVEATFRLDPASDTSNFATFATAEAACLTSTVPVHMVIDRRGTVESTPEVTRDQFVPLPTPTVLWDAPVTTSRRVITIARPSTLSGTATAAIISLEALNVEEAGMVQAYGCDGGPGHLVDLGYRRTRVANVAYVPIEAGEDICLFVYSPVHLRARLLGELAPDGPNPASLPPSSRYVPGEVPAPSLRSIVPERVLDTRSGVGRQGTVKVAADEEVELRFGDLVSPQTTAVILNVTANQTEAPGNVRVWPCGGDRPTVSNLNFDAGDTVPNLVVAKLGPGGNVCLASTARTHLIADLNGTFETDGGLLARPVSPDRIIDTRRSAPGKLSAGDVLEVQVTGGSIPGTAEAATVNVTAAAPDARGHITVFPCDHERPTASNLNFEAGQTVANLVTAKLSASGRLCIYTSAATHVVVDLAAWYGLDQSAGLVELAPKRFLDTREAVGIGTTHKVGGGSFIALKVGGVGDVPADADAVVMNLTIAAPEAPGFATAWPCDESMPTVSNLNYRAFETTPNLATVKLSATGTVCIYTLANAHLVADVAGYLTDEKIDGQLLTLQ